VREERRGKIGGARGRRKDRALVVLQQAGHGQDVGARARGYGQPAHVAHMWHTPHTSCACGTRLTPHMRAAAIQALLPVSRPRGRAGGPWALGSPRHTPPELPSLDKKRYSRCVTHTHTHARCDVRWRPRTPLAWQATLASHALLHYRLLTLCPAPTDPVGQSSPRGTGSVGRGAQGQ